MNMPEILEGTRPVAPALLALEGKPAAAPAVSQALLVGGPLHGAVMPLPSERAVTLMPESEGEQYLYVRRSAGEAQVAAETALFVYGGKPTPAQVQDAVSRSSLSSTARLRVLSVAPK